MKRNVLYLLYTHSNACTLQCDVFFFNRSIKIEVSSSDIDYFLCAFKVFRNENLKLVFV